MQALEIYETLLKTYGAPRWWSEDPYTVMFQSILVQNTSWTSVEKVTASIGGLTPERIVAMTQDELIGLIRPCGFSTAKSAAILRLTAWFKSYDYDASRVMEKTKEELRKELLSIKGVGAETADVLLVYAFHKASFVIDAYTRRFLQRLGFDFTDDRQIRAFFESGLPDDYRLYGWFHWLILDHCIARCRKTPDCTGCPFKETDTECS